MQGLAGWGAGLPAQKGGVKQVSGVIGCGLSQGTPGFSVGTDWLRAKWKRGVF